MKIAIVGLGLIGGSLAKAVKEYTDHTVLGLNRSAATLEKALNCGAIDETREFDDPTDADVTILCLYPEQIISYIECNAAKFKKGSLVVDAAGIKETLCREVAPIARANGFNFIGGHPMAGKEVNGFDNSEAELFANASFIIVPCGANDDESMAKLKQLALDMKFKQTVTATPKKHDLMIAYTSQLPHVLACAYIANEAAREHEGFSAGSFRDVSRVANINETLWAQLFLDNSTALCTQIDDLVKNLILIEDAVKDGNKENLEAILRKARIIKSETK